MGLTGEGTTADELWELGSREAIADHIRELADERLAAKAAEVGEEDWRTVERLVLIRTIDSLWVEHLTELDDMRRGIGLRGYAQQDPLNEFKREAFQLYDELREPDPPRRRRRRSSGSPSPASPPPRRRATRRWPPRSPSGAAALDARRRHGRHGRASATARPGRRAGADRRGRRARVPAAAAVGGSAILRGGPAPPPTARPMRESLGDEPVASRAAARLVGRRPEARLHPERCPDRAQRSVLVRIGREVQEVPRALSAAARDATVPTDPRETTRHASAT